MTLISPAVPGIVLINVFTVQPGGQPPLIAHLSEATETVMRRQPGFISANLHRSLDGARVANYAQWRSRADFDAMLQDRQAKDHMAEARRLGDVEGTLYELGHVEKAGSEVRIAAGTVPLTLIVVMKCEPAEQAELFQYLIETAQDHGTNPGFVSCNIHRSLDGSRVAEYIQWESAEALGGMAKKPGSQAHFARVRPRSSSAQYEVTETFSAAGL
jgi:heme-degrading monooxygenase HmoA